MFNIFMACTTIHFHFLHKLGLNISWTLYCYSIPIRSSFHLLLDGWVFPNVLNIISSTNELCFTFQNYPHNSFHVSIGYLINLCNFVICKII
jgi:hypothetical protein